jgi:hypothetical protein
MTKPATLLLWMLALATGCASQTARTLSETAEAGVAIEQSVALPAPVRGLQVETVGSLIAPGTDERTCEVVALPGSPDERYYVNRIEAALSAHGQDVVISAALPASETAAIMDVGTRVPCTRAGEVFGEELIQVFATQDTYAEERFPAGVGRVLHGGQKLAIETHFVNESSDMVPAKLKVSLHTVDAESITRAAHTASFQNFTIYTPPLGESSHIGECRLDQDVIVSHLARRTQRYGTRFRVWRAGGDNDGELLWDSQESRAAAKDLLDAPLQLAAGEALRFQCDYRNTSDRELRYGVSAADETCALEATFSGASATPAQDQTCLLFSVDVDGIARK